ncbi:MAG: TetR/AcrR family transcriptional regulator [Bacteroidales bacterium]
MQIQKDFIKEEVVRVAKREFLENGFQKASLRNIAKEVGATTGIIYTYFKNKDELFEEVVRPALLFAEHRFSSLDNLEAFKNDISFGKEAKEPNNYFPLSSLVENFREELLLLMFKSGGSKREGFTEDVISKKTEQYYRNLKKMEDQGMKFKVEVDPLIVRMPAKLLMLIIGEMVNSGMDRQALINYEKKALPFLHSAWKAII